MRNTKSSDLKPVTIRTIRRTFKSNAQPSEAQDITEHSATGSKRSQIGSSARPLRLMTPNTESQVLHRTLFLQDAVSEAYQALHARWGSIYSGDRALQDTEEEKEELGSPSLFPSTLRTPHTPQIPQLSRRSLPDDRTAGVSSTRCGTPTCVSENETDDTMVGALVGAPNSSTRSRGDCRANGSRLRDDWTLQASKTPTSAPGASPAIPRFFTIDGNMVEEGLSNPAALSERSVVRQDASSLSSALRPLTAMEALHVLQETAVMLCERMEEVWFEQFMNSEYGAAYLRLRHMTSASMGAESCRDVQAVAKGGFGTVFST